MIACFYHIHIYLFMLCYIKLGITHTGGLEPKTPHTHTYTHNTFQFGLSVHMGAWDLDCNVSTINNMQ